MIPFDDLKITTMTLVVYLDGNIDLYPVFDLLEYVTDAVPVMKKSNRKKIEFETYPIPGSIINLSFGGVTRGYSHSKNTKQFKNSIGMITSIKEKNLAIKLSSYKIHITGAKSESHGVECANHMIRRILDIQDQLDYIQKHEKEAHRVVDMLLEKSRGPIFPNTEALAEELDHQLIPIEELRQELAKDRLDSTILEFYLRYYRYTIEFPSYKYFSQFLRRARLITYVGSRDLKVNYVHKVMLNYNYDIGFDVKRSQLSQLLHDINGFQVNYNNLINYTVTVFLPFPPELKALPPYLQKREDEIQMKKLEELDRLKPRRKPRQKPLKKKEKKLACHTFLVYKTGQITFSTNGNYKSMKDAYESFNQTMEQLRALIMQPNEHRDAKKKLKREKKLAITRTSTSDE